MLLREAMQSSGAKAFQAEGTARTKALRHEEAWNVCGTARKPGQLESRVGGSK